MNLSIRGIQFFDCSDCLKTLIFNVYILQILIFDVEYFYISPQLISNFEEDNVNQFNTNKWLVYKIQIKTLHILYTTFITHVKIQPDYSTYNTRILLSQIHDH